MFNTPWYFYSIIAMLSFSGMILFIKRIRDLSFSSKQINLFLFTFVFLGFLLVNIGSFADIAKSPNLNPFIFLVFLASIVAVFANLFSIKAIGIAPNPGYHVVLKDTNILPVIILSVLIFGSQFNVIKFLGAIFILIGIALLLRKEPLAQIKQKTQIIPWYIYSLGAALLFTLGILFMKQVTLLGFSSQEINLFLFGFSWIGFLLINLRDFKTFFTRKDFSSFLKLIFLAAICSFFGNLSHLQGLKLAPNPGYHVAIKSSNILPIMLFSTKFFSSDFTVAKVFGTIIIIMGITLLSV